MRCRRHSLPLGQTSVPDRFTCSSLPVRCDNPSPARPLLAALRTHTGRVIRANTAFTVLA